MTVLLLYILIEGIEVKVKSLFLTTVTRFDKEQQDTENLILFFVVAAFPLNGVLDIFVISGRSLMAGGTTRKMILVSHCM